MMKENNYSEIVNNVFKIYRLARKFIILWIVITVTYALGEMIYNDTSYLTNFKVYWPFSMEGVSQKLYLLTINSFLLVSKSLPVFFMVIYTSLSLKASRIVSSSLTKSILVFWFVQAFNFVFILPNDTGLFSLSLFQIDSNPAIWSISIMLLTASPFMLFLAYRAIKSKKTEEKEDLDNLTFLNEKSLRIPHNLYVGIISAIIALLFDMNLQTQNLTISNGILFGLALSLIILPKDDLQKIVLFFIAPDTFYYAYQELKASHQLEISEIEAKMRNRQTEIASKKSMVHTQAAKDESINKIHKLLSIAGKKFVETKYSDIETRIDTLTNKLEKGEINLTEYSQEMNGIFVEIQKTYQDVKNQEIKMLPNIEKEDEAKE